MQGYGLTEETARKLKHLLGDQTQGEPTRNRRPRGRVATLVKCTSASPASGSGAGAQCYPAVVLVDEDDATTQTTAGACWLTVWNDSGAATTPTSGRVYTAVLAGHLDIGGTVRQRAFAPVGPTSSSITHGEVKTTGSAYDVTADDTWQNTGFSTLSLPSAGTYLLHGTIKFWFNISALGSFGGRMLARLYDTTNAAAVPGTTVVTHSQHVVNLSTYATCAFLYPYTVTGAATIRLEGFRRSGPTWTASQLGSIDATTGDSTFGYIQLS